MEHDPCLGGYGQRWRTSLAHGKRHLCPSVQKESSQWAGVEQWALTGGFALHRYVHCLSVCLSVRLSPCSTYAGCLWHPWLTGQRTRKPPKGHWLPGEEEPRKEAGSKCDSWCPGQRGCSGNRDKLNSQGLDCWEQNLSVAKVEWFEEQLNFTSKSNIFSTGCLNTKIPPLSEGTVCECVCVCARVHVHLCVCVCVCVSAWA